MNTETKLRQLLDNRILIIDGAMGTLDEKDLQLWRSDLQLKSNTGHYYFAIDLNVAVLG